MEEDLLGLYNYMKILFVDVYLNIVTWGVYFNPGVASIAAVLDQNNISSEHYIVFSESDIKKLLKYLEDNHVEIIGFTVTEPTLESVAQVSREIRKEFPYIHIVCGGPHVILDPEDVLKKVDCDSVCVGEGEYAILKLIQGLENNSSDIYGIKNLWFKKDGKIIKNSFDIPIEINTLPDPNREIFLRNNLDTYRGGIYLKGNKKGCIVTLSRGCYFNCTFCGNWFLNTQYKGKYRRVLESKIAVDQLKRMIVKYSYDYLIFIDAQFPTNDEWLEEFSNLYKKEINLPFTIQLRFGTFNSKTVNFLKKAGCYFVQIGLESGNKELRYKILNKKIDDQLIVEGVELFKKKQMKVSLNNMIGMPTETPRKFIDTIQINAKLDPDYSYLFIYYPYKGTELYKYCFEHHLLRKQVKNFFSKENTTLRLKEFKKRDILYYYSHYQVLLSICKKSLKTDSSNHIFWKMIFQIYSVCPSERRGISGIYASVTEKFFLSKKFNHL